MIHALAFLFIGAASAITLQNQCQNLTVTSNELIISEIQKEKCKTILNNNKKSQEASIPFVGFSISNNDVKKKFKVIQRLIDTKFCKLPSVNVFDQGLDKTSNLKIWGSEDNFKKLISMSSMPFILELDLVQSKKNNNKICKPFPGFVRAVKFGTNLMPDYLPQLKNGGFMMLANRESTIYFMNSNLDQLEYAINFDNNYPILDSLFNVEGDLIVLTKNNLLKKNSERCISSWDILTNAKMREFCFESMATDQILLKLNDRLAYLSNDGQKIKLVLFDNALNFKKSFEIKVKRNFNLINSTIF